MWKIISDFPNYKVSDSGEVFSIKRGILLKPSNSKFGYARVTLYKDNGEKHKIMVHRLVAKAFIPNPNELEQVNHINENKLDNTVSNLEWCTSSYNINFGSRNGVVSEKLRKIKNETTAKPINQINIETNEIVRTWTSIREIERELGIPHSNIYACCTGKRKTRNGYKWRYA